MSRKDTELGLSRLPSDAQKLFVAICVSKVMPFVERFASKPTGHLAQEASDFVWRAAAVTPDPKVASALAKRIRSAPEAQLDDSATLAYYAGSALGVFHHALNFITRSDPTETVRCGRLVLELLGTVDSILRPNWPRPVITDPRNPPTPGAQQSAEASEQEYWATRLTAPDVSLDAVRERVDQRSGEIRLLLVKVETRWAAVMRPPHRT
jgi:hypothetical protein